MKDVIVHIKWVGPNSPLIKLPNGENIRLSKRDLMELSNELNEFISYYYSSFDSERIDNTDDPVGEC